MNVHSTPNVEDEKRLAAEAAAELVRDGMSIGLGTGSTVAYLLPALARRRLRVRCVATSPETASVASELGLELTDLNTLIHLDLAIDGADQVAPSGWLVKGGGGAHAREKIVAAAAARFVVIVSSDKQVEAVRAPIPLELSAFGVAATLEELGRIGEVRRRDAPLSPDGGVIADFLGEVGDPAELARRLSATPGVLAHGLFQPELVDEVLLGRGRAVERLAPSAA